MFCIHCNGFYGPSYGQPICYLCHAFLYPEFVSTPADYFLETEITDSDSGNDEPTEPVQAEVDHAQADPAPELENLQSGHVTSDSETSRSPSNREVETNESDRLVDLQPLTDERLHEQDPTGANGIEATNLNRPEISGQPSPSLCKEVKLTISPLQKNIGVSAVSSGRKKSNVEYRKHAVTFISSENDKDKRKISSSNDRRVDIHNNRLQHVVGGTAASADLNNVLSRHLTDDDNEIFFEATSPSVSRRLERLSVVTIHPEAYERSVPEIDCLPTEVVILIFGYLDDIALWSAANVCRTWRDYIDSEITQDQWREYVICRWPLFRPLYTINNWYSVYCSLMNSVCCLTCVTQMALRRQPFDRELQNTWRRNRVRNELRSLKTDPPEGIGAEPLDEQYCHWQATIRGPTNSPYEGGLFYLHLQISHSYPMTPPVVRFLTKIYHPNISRHGDIGLDSITHNWTLALTISKVLISIQSLLTDPFCDVAMEPTIAHQLQESPIAYENQARTWTWRYAMHEAMGPLKAYSHEKHRET